MSLTDFLWRYRYRFNRDYLLQELSHQQRAEALKDALRAVSEFYPRHNILGVAIQRANSSYIELPIDFFRATAAQLSSIPSVAQVMQPYQYTPASEIPYGYQGQYVPVTTNERRRHVVPLKTAASSNAYITIFYDAIHRIENPGVRIAVTSSPAAGDTVVINGTTFTFATTPVTDLDIPIMSTTYEQAQSIADVLLRQRFTLNIDVYDVDTEVYVRSVSSTGVVAALTSAALSLTLLSSVNTVPLSLETDVFQWMSAFLMQAQYRHAIAAGATQQAESLRQAMETEFQALRESYYSMGLHG